MTFEDHEGLDVYVRSVSVKRALRLMRLAGEMDGADRHVRDTLLLGASRIGHGVNLIKVADGLPPQQRALDLSGVGLTAGTTWRLYVKMVGVSSILNKMSPAVTWQP